MFSPWYRLYPHKTLIADSYFYLFYFWRDPCSSMKPGVHTVGRSVGRRALLFTVCSPSKWHFHFLAKKQTLQTQRISSSSSWSQLHWSSEDPDYCLSEIECFESSEEQKKCKTLSIIDCHQFCIVGIFKYTVDQKRVFTWLRLNSK